MRSHLEARENSETPSGAVSQDDKLNKRQGPVKYVHYPGVAIDILMNIPISANCILRTVLRSAAMKLAKGCQRSPDAVEGRQNQWYGRLTRVHHSSLEINRLESGLIKKLIDKIIDR